MVDLEVESLETFGSVQALVAHELTLNSLAELLLGWGSPVFRTLFWWTGDPFELMHILHTRHSEVGQIGPLEVVVDDPDLFGIVYGEALACVNRHHVA